MKRYLLATLILIAVTLGGAVAQASMVHATIEPHVLLQHQHLASGSLVDGEPQQGTADHLTSVACANACFGTVAAFVPLIEMGRIEINADNLWVPATRRVRGQLIDPAERPPNSI